MIKYLIVLFGILFSQGLDVNMDFYDRIEIELNAPIFLHIEPDLKSLNKILSDISRDIYIVHSNIINLYSIPFFINL